MRIPVMKPALPSTKDVVIYLQQMDSSRIYSNFGPLLVDLESRYAEFFSVKPEKVVCSANATLAILGACQIIPGLDLDLPSYTFPATIQAGLLSGKKVAMRDVEHETYSLINLDSKYRGSLNSVNQIFVLPYGGKLEIPSVTPGTYQVIDAAASIGNYEGNLSDIKETQIFCFSLHATKVLGAGEGAVSVFGSEDVARKFRSWINFGFNGSRESQELGINAKMSEITAAYAHASLDAYPVEKRDWLRVGKKQYEIGKSLSINPSFATLDSITPYWIAEFEDFELRSRVAHALKENNIETRKWWGDGCHTMKAFSNLAGGDFSNTSDMASRVLGLPKYRDLTYESIELIESIIRGNLP